MPRRLGDPRRGARGIAHEVLVRVETTDAFADVLLDHRLAEASVSPAERRLATQLVLGTLAWRGWLDARLGHALDRPLGGLDPPVRAALRLGAFQLLRLDRIPRHAAINETVALAGHRGARGLVNAVLRRVADAPRGDDATPRDPVAAAAARTSHPEWIARLLAADVVPDDLEALLVANNEPVPTALRVHAARAVRTAVVATLAASGVETRAGRWARSALVVTRGAARLRRHPLLADGSVTVQSEASQLVVDLLDPTGDERIVDLCAAPGGKTGAIAERLGAGGLVVAIDPTVGGARRVRATAARLGGNGTLVVVADGRRPPFDGRFDAVLVDAPCSGLGTLRRHPEIRWRRRPDDLPRLAALQAELLDAAACLVRDGGRLVYAVCTLTRAETWDVVEPWLARHPAFRIEPAGSFLAPEAAPLVHRAALRTLPAPHGLDGFFAVRLSTGA